jgi:hypothetical protein
LDVLFAGICHNAYETGLESCTYKHVSITLFWMKSIPKIFVNFKDGNIAFYFSNIKREIKQSPKLMELYHQFRLKSFYKFQTSWSRYLARRHSQVTVTEILALIHEASRRTLNAKSWADRRVEHMEFS